MLPTYLTYETVYLFQLISMRRYGQIGITFIRVLLVIITCTNIHHWVTFVRMTLKLHHSRWSFVHVQRRLSVSPEIHQNRELSDQNGKHGIWRISFEFFVTYDHYEFVLCIHRVMGVRIREKRFFRRNGEYRWIFSEMSGSPWGRPYKFTNLL